MMNKLRHVFAAFVLCACASCLFAPRIADAASYPYSYYQLRDVSGLRDGHTIAGSQWFATVTEGWWENNVWHTRWDTHGGEAPGVPMVTSADLIHDFSSVYLEDPQRENNYGNDPDFDPIESVYLVIKEGRGELKLNFGNDYSYHTPYGAQDAMEDVLLSVPDYAVQVRPSKPELVEAGKWLQTEMAFQADSPQSYGSSLGYLTFRQSASFDKDFKGYRESIKIPLVVANVFDGLAAESGNELYFDMSVFDGGEIVTRNKFHWGADGDMTRDLGTFFMVYPAGSTMPQYELRSRITNRTGVRYRAQRYDTLGSKYQDIYPEYWAYDLTPDLYGTLPAEFRLDQQSQIAPGLVTAYASTIDMSYGSSESFRLYPYQGSAAAKDLRLSFRKVGGMTPYGTVSSAGTVAPWTVTGFSMIFADVIQNGENTSEEIAGYAGGTPVIPLAGYAFAGAADQYVKADAFNSFAISADVPSDLVGSDDVALLPLRIRLRVSRKEAPIVGKWSEIADADSVINAFASTCAVWVRSPHTSEQDMNLFTTLRNRGYSVEKCVQAFTYGDYLYLDFIVLLADAVSQNTGKTAFCQVVEDDKIPYILIGDGKVDGKWNLGFYVALTGSNPNPDPTPNPTPSSGGGGGGGCSQGFAVGFLPMLLLFLLAVKLKATE